MKTWMNGLQKTTKRKKFRLCMEATGVYHENCLYFSERKIIPIIFNKVYYLISLGLKSKNDSIDARGLSKMGAEQCLELWRMGKFFMNCDNIRQYQNLQEQKNSI
jgi:hypothetical protein